ncbi:hypothetical protein EHYA_08858 [Embleya hyalina]|uniref:Uncharacterized protein n=1 Tax=Embleya hyalina TaxID=516124 RepID=A0A401Z2K4_9ACTN|nr:hypothetical protein EHYA_08858 [Embleya hyalina]
MPTTFVTGVRVALARPRHGHLGHRVEHDERPAVGHGGAFVGSNGWSIQRGRPSSLAISMRWTSLVPSPISRILASRQKRATGNSFMKP